VAHLLVLNPIEMKAGVALARRQHQRLPEAARDDAQPFEVGLEEATRLDVGSRRDDIAWGWRGGRVVLALELVVVRNGMVGLTEGPNRLDQAVDANRDQLRRRRSERDRVQPDRFERDKKRVVDYIERDAFSLRLFAGRFAARRLGVARAVRVKQLEAGVE
jgi:hypothetical protein